MRVSKSAVLRAISMVLAAALTVSGLRAHAQNSLPGLCRQRPGVFIGLLSGFALDNQILVVIVTIAANTCFCYLLLSLLARIGSRFYRAP